MTTQGRSIRRRHVLFLSGFDPKGASYYHRLYRSEAQKQSAVNGLSMEVSARQRDVEGNSFWRIDAQTPDGMKCRTTYEFAQWDDIVRRHWPRSMWRLLGDMLRAYALALGSGVIPAVWRLSRKTLTGLALPLVVLGGGMALGTLLGLSAMVSAHKAGLGWPASLVTGLLLWLASLWWTRKLEDKLNTTWLVRIFSFVGKQASGQLPELETRLDALAAQLGQKLRDDAIDEILVVGFSVGSILAASTLARALRSAKNVSRDSVGPVLSLMTLGHCIPMLGLLPQARDFRQELGELAQNPELVWLDFSSPTDWGSFALIEPVRACKVALPHGMKSSIVMRSPRFHAMFPAGVYAHLRRNKRRLHLQYLMAGLLPTEYDYFATTAGTLTLCDRYAAF